MTALLAHYVMAAFAKFRRTPVTSAANVATLALGLACFMAAWGIVAWLGSADDYHRNAERTFVVGQRTTMAGQERSADLLPRSSATVARYLREDFPEIEHVVRVRGVADVPVAAVDRKDLLDAAYVEPEFTSVFDLDFVQGDPQTALSEPGGIVLTQDSASRLFGDAAALGRSLRIDGSWDGVVTGVIAPVRQPSFMGAGPDAALPFDMLTNWSNHPAAAADTDAQWFVPIIYTVVVLPESLALEAFNARLERFAADRIPSNPDGLSATLRAFPVGGLSTFALDALARGAGGRSISAISVLIGLGMLTLAVACVNYANLATAQAAANAKEIGLRKTLGAGRLQVMAQTWVEALLAAIAAAAAALAALALAAPVALSAIGVDILFFLETPSGAFALVALVAGAAFLSGLYPALVLSGVRPMQALRSGRARGGPRLVARVLVGVQFASASFLLILVIVTQGQREHLVQSALEPREDPILILADVSRHGIDYDTLAGRLRQLPGVTSVSVADKLPLGVAGANVVQLSLSAEAGTYAPAGYFRAVGLDYFATFNLRVLAGRVFDAARNDVPVDMGALDPAVAPPMVVDRIYARRLGFATPEAAVDQVVYMPAALMGSPTAQPARIIGVTEAEPPPLEAGEAEGTAYFFAPRVAFGGQRPMVRVDPERLPTVLPEITRVWDELAPDIPANIQFFDQIFQQSFRTYARVGQLFMALAGSAFVIASIGLLGMAVHVASRRRHEIGVRKTLGSTTLGIVRLLLIDFSKPVLAANLLAWPLGFAAAQVYLQGFADRVPLTPAPFALSMAITLAIAWAAIIGEVLKAASVRPAEVLRHA